MVLPTDKSAKAFNVSTVKLNHEYSGDYRKLTKQALESNQKIQEMQKTLYFEEDTARTHERVGYWVDLLQRDIKDFIESRP